MYTTIPAIAAICNIFLLSTLLTAKKTSELYAYMAMLVACIMWTGGALFMRMEMAPGVGFWWTVSMSGIFLIPYVLYLVTSFFAESRGAFSKIVFGLMTVVILVMNGLDMYITEPEVVHIGGHTEVHYTANMLCIIPTMVGAIILFAAGRVLIRGVRKNGMPLSYLTPFIAGTLIMFVGVFMDIIPALNSLPLDSLSCAMNAVCVYYAFYKKRVYSLHQITSRGGMYVLTLMIVALIASPVFSRVGKYLSSSGITNINTIYMVVAVFCAAVAIVIFIILNKLNNALFIKEQTRKEGLVKEFSAEVNASLQVDSIMSKFLELAKEETDAGHVYLCKNIEGTDRFESYNGIDTLEMPIVILKSNPVIEVLETYKGGLLYSDFKKSNLYKSMWEEEKRILEYLKIEYILPFRDEDKIMGFALFSQKVGKKTYGYDEMNFLESVAAVASIALKNAQLYSQLEREAKLDTLTNLYNRREFNKQLNELFSKKSSQSISMILFNLDDFSLYNELYGNEEGDQMLQRFAAILNSVFGSKGVIARYGGKEFAALLPYADAETAKQYAERVKAQLVHQIESSKENTKKFLTFSAGVCAYPAVASNANELVTYVNLAIFHIKQHGKNKIEIYHHDSKFASEAKDKKEHIYELTSTIYALTAAIDAKDHYTFNHSRCVSEYAAKLAGFAGLPDDFVEIIRQAGLLHDIGKISIPDAILTKQGRLTNEEFQIMRQHVERSIEMIRHLPSLDYVIPAVVGHHERYDGKGYPRGISGEDIPIGARCLSIADAFDAMISKRSYKDKMSVESSLTEILLNLGKQFDPELGRLFVEKVRSGEIEVIDY